MHPQEKSAGSLSSPAIEGGTGPQRPQRRPLKASPAHRGHVVERGPLSFQTITRRRGHFVSCNHFDVPEQEYGEGWQTGIAAAAELMAALRGGEEIDLLPILEDACRAADLKPASDPGPCTRGAAVGFLRMLEHVIKWSRNWDHGSYFEKYAEELRAGARRREAEAEQRKAALVQRLRAGREAARKARQGGCSMIAAGTMADQLQRGAEAFADLMRDIGAISDATCGGEGPDSRDYRLMVERVQASIEANLHSDEPTRREGYLRALALLLCLNADGAGMGAGEYDAIAATADAFNDRAEAAHA